AEVYTLTDAEVIADLVFAHRRGAVVRVVLDPNRSYNQRAFVLLRTGGVEVRWYPVPKGVLLHAKIGLFDGLLVLGSANWTLSGLGVNHELDVVVAHVAVVEASGELELVLGRGQVLLQVRERGDRLQLGIVLRHGEQAAQALGEHVLRLADLGRVACRARRDRVGPGIGDSLQGPTLLAQL